MSDIGLNLHLEWFWVGLVLVMVVWLANRLRPRAPEVRRASWWLIGLLAPLLGVIGGVLAWIVAAVLGGWW